ncbi:MAG TPA: hypothetical protein VFT87_01315 [Candidatus Saccharimonadales bacterium]|nr:hypothetical protein [Candidatus Saccharimonadales bacterium]
MKQFFLTKVRLTYYYPTLLLLFMVIIWLAPTVPLNGPQLTLFTVNSFLLGFYLGPILGGQKQRIEDLAKTIRLEAIALFNIAVQAQDLGDTAKHKVKTMARAYLQASLHSHKPAEGEQEYERFLRFCIDYTGKDKDQLKKIQETLIKNQENRAQFSALLRNSVFSHEWFVLCILMGITLSFIVVIDYGSSLLLTLVAALLCTGLSLLFIILAKLATLTHKKAKPIWQPFKRLLETDFKHIDQ